MNLTKSDTPKHPGSKHTHSRTRSTETAAKLQHSSGSHPPETVHPDIDTAQAALSAQDLAQIDADAIQTRRAPTPYSRRRSMSSRMDSNTSLKSTVSFDSGNPSRPQNLRIDIPNDENFGHVGSPNWVDRDKPHFGAARGIGPAGEAIEYIGLGRKEPRHRKFQPGMLKPALRTTSTRLMINPTPFRIRDKPLPFRPSSSISFRGPPQSSRGGGLSSLFSSLTLDLRRTPSRHSAPIRLLSPIDDLFTYLRIVDMPAWTRWEVDSRKSLFGFSLGSGGGKGFESMGYEWRRRFYEAEQGRLGGRWLRWWIGGERSWEGKICECEYDQPRSTVNCSDSF